MIKNKKTLVAILSCLLIIILLFTNNKIDNAKNDIKVTKKKKSTWTIPSGREALINIYADDSSNILTSKNSKIENYKFLNSYKCKNINCVSYGYNTLNNHIVIKDDSYLIYDYNNNLYKKISLRDDNYTDIKLLSYGKKDYALSIRKDNLNYAFYSLTDNSFKTDYIYKEIFSNNISYIDNKFIAIDNDLKYNIVDYKLNKIIYLTYDYIGSVGCENTIYYYIKKDDGYIFYDKKFNLLLDNNKYNIFGITKAGNLVVTKDNKSFYIYNKNATLIKKSKPYLNIYYIVDKYLIVKDNDNFIKIIDFDSNVIEKLYYYDNNKIILSASYQIENKNEYINISIMENNLNYIYSYSFKDKNIDITYNN